MNDIINIISLTLDSLNKQKKIANPTNFETEFYKQLQKTDLILEETEEIKEIVSKLSTTEKKQLTSDITTFRELSLILSQRVSNQTIREFLKDFSYFISSSIDKTMKEDIDKVCLDIAKNPESLMDSEVLRELRKLTDRRINNDKKLFKDKTSDVKKLIGFLGEYINKFLVNHTSTYSDISKLKEEIYSLELSESSLKDLEQIKSDLISSIDKFETSLVKTEKNIIKNQLECNNLYEQIEELQHNLDKAEEEKSIDFLTNVLTRRAYAVEIERLENEFKIYDSNYALVFYDIDHFKEINDMHGHDCGDSVLSTFAQILKNLTRTGDIIARYGGEEFISIVNYKNKMEIKNYLKRVKNIISNNRFVYNDIKINVKFSAGVAYRKNYNSYEETIKKADELLYTAKAKGRNKIIIDNAEEI
ncbi:GGDEF domain-containing protein [Halarcobacter bivalviorum]|uniref:GGDEF domain-containing protein n=1 Tax=Halarcobacter bivalviorum TaxID=663364 RepID=UPI00100B591F|nr:GGDEF domain-containing protein [Halarcobacter bivalviorum]RXK07024.1 GGDEF domain-containing protein [Halarcobacter bivalviorum]